MTRPKKTRVNLTLSGKEMHELERSKPSGWHNATWLKHLAFVALCNAKLLGVTRRNLALLDVTTPRGHARAGTYSGKEEEENKSNTKKGECEGGKTAAKRRPASKLAPLDTTKRILDYLNLKAGTGYQARGKKTRELIAARLAEGWQEKDFRVVVDKKCLEWIGTDMARYLQPETLFGTKFEKYHGQLAVGPKRSPAFTEGEKRAERNHQLREIDHTKGEGIIVAGVDAGQPGKDIPF